MNQNNECAILIKKYYPILNNTRKYAEIINNTYSLQYLIELNNALEHIYQCLIEKNDDKISYEIKCAEAHFKDGIIATLKDVIDKQNNMISTIMNNIDKLPLIEKDNIISYNKMLDDFYDKLNNVKDIDKLDEMKTTIYSFISNNVDNFESITKSISKIDKNAKVFDTFKIFIIFLTGVLSSGIFLYVFKLLFKSPRGFLGELLSKLGF